MSKHKRLLKLIDDIHHEVWHAAAQSVMSSIHAPVGSVDTSDKTAEAVDSAMETIGRLVYEFDLESRSPGQHLYTRQDVKAICEKVIEAGRVDGMFIEWNGLNLSDIAKQRQSINSIIDKWGK